MAIQQSFVSENAFRQEKKINRFQYFLRYLASYFQTNAAFLTLAALFIGGLAVGTALVQSVDEQMFETLSVILGGYITRRQTQVLAAIFANSFLSVLSILLLLFFCGYCAIAQPIIALVPFFKGLGYGFSIASLYVAHSTDAILYVLCMILPHMLLSTLLILIACRASLRMSVVFLRSTKNADEQNRFTIRQYCLKFIVFTATAAILSLADGILVYYLGKIIVL